MEIRFEYDVSLSFAGEDRDFVREVAAELKENGIKVFYDEYEQIQLWGTNLYVHLDEVYRTKSRYCVIFISKFYKEKLWTNYERESAQARAFNENSEYILPFRFDNTEIPGIRETTGYLSSDNVSSKELAEAIISKLGKISKIPDIERESDLPDSSSEESKMLEPGVLITKEGSYEIRIRRSDFFSYRLSKAFPGVRGLKWFEDPKLINNGFEILFRNPIQFDIFPGKKEMEKQGVIAGRNTPIWWFRSGGSMAITEFRRLSASKCLIGWDEYEINKIAIYRDSRSYRDFIYVEVMGESPISSIDQDVEESLKFQLEYKQYATQEYALFKEEPVTVAEYDDGSIIRNGEIINLNGEAEIRRRFLTKFNFIICSQQSTYNSVESDKLFGDWMDEKLRNDDAKLEDLLPRLLEIELDPIFRFSQY